MFNWLTKWFQDLFTKELREKLDDAILKARDAHDFCDENVAKYLELQELRKQEATKVERAEEWEMIANNLVVENQNRAYQVRSLSQRVLRLADELRRAEEALAKNDPFLREQKKEEGKDLRGFTKSEIMFMIKSCHPDRHDGSEVSTDVARKLILLR